MHNLTAKVLPKTLVNERDLQITKNQSPRFVIHPSASWNREFERRSCNCVAKTKSSTLLTLQISLPHKFDKVRLVTFVLVLVMDPFLVHVYDRVAYFEQAKNVAKTWNQLVSTLFQNGMFPSYLPSNSAHFADWVNCNVVGAAFHANMIGAQTEMAGCVYDRYHLQ